ncbi:MAG: DUF1294 domain-containing protein [Lachnospiraceae bacterium]|nr:DUF1294 domain-containing protein [Lachnospiraceae bacterium]
MEFSLTLLYQCTQVAAVVFLAAWIFTVGKGLFGSICRSLGLFCAIAAPITLFLSLQEKAGLIIWIYLGITAAVFLVFALDKLLAVNGGNVRIPENILVILSVIGVLGALSGMVVFHHKNKKAKLQYSVPAIAAIELAVLWILKLRQTVLPELAWKNFGIFQWMTVVTTVVLCLVLIRTYILMRLLVIIPVSLAAALFSLRTFYRLDSSVTMLDMIKAKPIPFIIIAAVVFAVLELIAVKSRFFTSGNEVRKKTEH